MISIVDKIIRVHRGLDSHGLAHAFGGALALAWCTERARGTIDIDINIFVPVDRVDEVLTSLPTSVHHTSNDRDALLGAGQTRLWWENTPIDVFLNTTPFHEAAAGRARVESFAGHDVPFLACRDIAVFKAFFDRPRDWVDLGEMFAAGTLDAEIVLGVLATYLGGDDHRVARLRAVAAPPP